MNYSNNNAQKLEVIVPINMGPGQALNVEALDGKIYNIIIPENVRGGDALVVVIPNATDNNIPITVATPVDDNFYSVTPGSNSTTDDVQLNVPNQVDNNISRNAVAVGASSTAFVVGALCVGPVTGIIVAGAALYATTRNDKAGEVTRSIGQAAVSSFRKTKELADEYKVTEKLQSAYTATAKKASDIDQEYKLTERAISVSKDIATAAKEADSKYKITENVSSMITRGILAGSKEISRLTSTSNATHSSGSRSSVNNSEVRV